MKCEKNTAFITDVKHFAIHDGDGIRTTVFFKGCPLRCIWCHNPETISRDAQMAFYTHKCVGCGECEREDFKSEDCLGNARIIYGREVEIDELFDELLEDRDFYINSGGGVTLSGGECLLQADFCAELLKRLKKEGINTAIDTCGCLPWSAFEAVLPYTDIFLYDLKAVDPETHKRCTGVSNELIIENLRRLDSLGANIEIRIPYVPGYNGGEIEAIATLIREFSSVKAVRLLPYHDLARSKYKALGMTDSMPRTLPSEEEIKTAQEVLLAISGKPIMK